jgi:hypothetical protein
VYRSLSPSSRSISWQALRTDVEDVSSTAADQNRPLLLSVSKTLDFFRTIANETVIFEPGKSHAGKGMVCVFVPPLDQQKKKT